MHDTLVLDMAGHPVGTVSWQRAVKMYWEDRADILIEDEKGKLLRSPSFEMGMPRVVRAKEYVVKRLRKSVPCSRSNVYIRDNGQCQYCGVHLGTEDFTLDHVLPRAQGGVTKWTNVVVACIDCNHHKDGRTPLQAHMHLRSVPREPKPNEGRFFMLRVHKLRPEWKPWASHLYWNVTLEE